MKKQLLSFVALLCVVWLTPARALAYFEVDGIYYRITSSSNPLTVEVTNNGIDDCYAGLITIPETVTYNNVTYSVTSIGYMAFKGCQGLTSIEIPASVTSIDAQAFEYCSGLTSIEIPARVTSIGRRAFTECYGLTSIEIPASVTSIGVEAFRACTHLTSVEIPARVTSLSWGVFYQCIRLTSIKIPDSVTSIGGSAFAHCTGLTSIEIPASVTTIYESAFVDCTGLTSIEIPASVTRIGEEAFYNCTGLTSIEIPASLTSIGTRTFNGCTELTSITWNAKNMVSFSDYSSSPFYTTRRQITEFIIGDEVTSIPAYLCYGMNKLKSVTIPASVTSIGEEAFLACGLTSIAIPASVTSIGEEAFRACGLTSIEIPNSVTSIGEAAFQDCSGLKSIEIPASVTSIERYTFYGCGLTSVKIPDSVTSIGDYAFYDCDLTSISIPASVTSIGDYAFCWCMSLNTVISRATVPPTCSTNTWSNFNKSNCTLFVPTGTKAAYAAATGWKDFINIKEISDDFEKDGIYYKFISSANRLAVEVTKKDGSFYSGVITVPERVTYNNVTYSVTSIGDYAFDNCSGLTSIAIPARVTSIGDYAFCWCTSLNTVISYATVPPTCSTNTWSYVNKSTCTLFVPAGTKAAYAAATEWKDFKNIEEISDNFETDGIYYKFISSSNPLAVKVTNNGNIDGAYAGEITIPETVSYNNVTYSVTSIGYTAFRNCSGLTSIEIPASVTTIDDSAFAYCSGLTSIEIPTSVTSIGVSAFYNCSGLTSIEIPASVTSIGSYAFQNCRGLTSVEIPASVTSIGNYTFYDCRGLTSIKIPDSVTSIGGHAFDGCSGLTSIEIPASVTSIAVSAFRGCTGLTSVTIPNSVTSIGDQAFIGCTGLTSVTIPNSVTTIGEGAFYVCTGLTKIKCLAQTPPACGDDVFYNVPSTCVLEVPVGTKAAYAAAAGWSAFTNIVEAQDIEPAEEDVTVSFGNDINEETNLSDNVVNNTYYNLNSTNGDGYDATEQGIVLNSTTSAADLEAIAGLDISDEAVSANYHGLIIQVAAGSGTISVDVKTIGSHILNVKIGDGAPTQISKSERGTVDVPYNVSEPTYVYVYATGSGNSSAPIYRAPSAGANSVILYGYGIKLDDTTAIDTLNGEQEALTDDCKIFTLGGQQVNELQPGMNIVRMKNGTVKKVFIK